MLKSMGYSGESHQWTGTAKVVVDLGYGPSGGAAAVFRPDVVVLTHSDGDHIGGTDAFFQGIGRHPGGEIWMPYEWAVLIDAAGRLSAGVAPVSQHPVDANAIEAVARLAHVIGSDDARGEQDGGVPDAGGRGIRLDHDSIRDAVADAVFAPDYLDEGDWTSGEGFVRDALTEDDLGKVAANIETKAEKLAGILASAVRAGMTVRWFSVDHLPVGDGAEKWAVSGRPGVVSLVNAVEVEVGRVPPGWETAVLFATMRYSVQNRRALATLLWETPGAAHFVVWSDGDGTGCRLETLPWDRIGGMTAPHHGSEKAVHDPIWQAAAPHLAGMDVVLAGGTASQSLHPAFSAVASGARACTSCGRCRAAQARPRVRAHAPVHADVRWPNPTATCATGCGCAHHP